MALHTESFDQADSTTLGPDLTWTEIMGDLQTVGNRVRMVVANAADAYARADVDVATSDMYAKVRIITFPNTGTVGLSQRLASVCARCDAAGAVTFYMARLIYFLNTDQYEYRLNKVVAGAITQLGSSVVVTPAFPETVEVRCVGDQISCLRNGATIIGPITDTSIPTGTRGGLRLWERTSIANNEVDDFEVGSLTAAVPTPTNLNIILQPGVPG